MEFGINISKHLDTSSRSESNGEVSFFCIRLIADSVIGLSFDVEALPGAFQIIPPAGVGLQSDLVRLKSWPPSAFSRRRSC